jgi:hypothetical protein
MDFWQAATLGFSTLAVTVLLATGSRSSVVVVVDHGDVIAERSWSMGADAGSVYANMLWGMTDAGAPIEDVASMQKSLERMQRGGEGVVLYRAKAGHDGRPPPAGDAAEAFDPAEFVARVIIHIPKPRRHLVRYYGWYFNVSRGKRRNADARNHEGGDVRVGEATRAERDEARNARALRRSWAQLIKRIYEVDPLVCPSCGSEMRVIAFITEHDLVDAILRHLQRKEEARAPPS